MANQKHKGLVILQNKLTKHFYHVFYTLLFIKTQLILKTSSQIFLVYSIGKVGSSTIYNAFKKQTFSVFHIHFLNKKNIAEQEKYYKNSKRGSVPLTIIQSKILSNLLPTYKGKINIITLIREPISREISSIFQDLLIFENVIGENGFNRDSIKQIVYNHIYNLSNKLPENIWFETEFSEVFEIDIKNFKIFPNGFDFISKRNRTFMLVRMENLNEEVERAIKENYGIQVKLKNSNVANKKYYKDIYKQIMSELNLEEEMISKILNCEFYLTYYPDYREKVFKSLTKKEI
jgi:hypothetical protein